MRVPYDNGKIKIGSNYNPDLRPEIDADMEYLQTALIGDVDAIRRGKVATVIYVAVAVLALFGYFLFN